jgi:hypothetical protein
MQTGQIIRFRTIEELQSLLGNYLDDLKKKTDEYSKIVGEKLRSEQSSKPEDFAELKEKIDGQIDPKKKKPVKKKNQKTNWLDFGAISIYEGIGIKGELELYFKALEELKLKIDRVEKIKNAVDNLVSKSLKKDIGCVALMNHELPFEINFLKSSEPRSKFSYKAIFHVVSE